MPRRKQPQLLPPLPQKKELEQLLTTQDVASLMQMHPATIHRLVHSSGLPSVMIGKSRRFEASAVLDWIEQHRVS